MNGVTVLYYTGNFKPERFEEKIRANILEQIGDLPLVSVSTIPLVGFGENIVVPLHDKVYPNVFRTIRIGLDAVHTEYVLTAEDDTLYPPEYFRFTPPERGRCYRYYPVYVVWPGSARRYYFKGWIDSAQCIDTDLYKQVIDEKLANFPGWSKTGCAPLKRVTPESDPSCTWEGSPVVVFKSRDSISNRTYTARNVSPVYSLPYWGSVGDLLRRVGL